MPVYKKKPTKKQKPQYKDIAADQSSKTRVKLATRRRADRFADVFDMGQEKVDIIDSMLVRGKTCVEVADKIQNEWGFHTEKKKESLKRQLNNYRQEYIFGQLIANVDHPTWNERSNGGQTGPLLDAHELMQSIAITQVTRLNKLYAREEALPTLMDQVRKEIETLHRITRDLGSMQFDLGYMRRVPKKVAVDMGVADLTGERARHNESKKSYEAINEAATKLEKVLGGLGTDEDIEDGEYTESED